MTIIYQGIKSGRPQFQMEKGPPKWLLDAIGGRRLKDASPAYVEDGQFRTKTKVFEVGQEVRPEDFGL